MFMSGRPGWRECCQNPVLVDKPLVRRFLRARYGFKDSVGIDSGCPVIELYWTDAPMACITPGQRGHSDLPTPGQPILPYAVSKTEASSICHSVKRVPILNGITVNFYSL